MTRGGSGRLKLPSRFYEQDLCQLIRIAFGASNLHDWQGQSVLRRRMALVKAIPISGEIAESLISSPPKVMSASRPCDAIRAAKRAPHSGLVPGIV